ncbi:MAG: SAM-dependent chlorinase/fluorinase [Thermodesulfobacteriota bacterium]
MRPLITLTSDFGLDDEYVGLMKGVIRGISPDAGCIDITHSIPAGDIQRAARTIAHSYPFFPQNTIHLVVVDPGVGSDRHILCLQAEGHLFVGPDNGVFTLLLDDDKVTACYRVTNEKLFRSPVSPTFHGRDIMAPVTARLAAGLEPAEVGEQVAVEECVTIRMAGARIENDGIYGEVIQIDHFGNIQTSITADDLLKAGLGGRLCVTIDQTKLTGRICQTYSQADSAHPIFLIDSRRHLEISVNGGSAADILNCSPGCTVTVKTA